MLTEREVAWALGAACDGNAVSAAEAETLRAALAGAVPTDRGPRLYYADLDTLMLGNVDTDEGLWSTPEDGFVRGGGDEVLADLKDDGDAIRHGLFPLAALTDPARMAFWRAAMERASNHERRRWARFRRRVFRPLMRHLAGG